jgi:hypothetical protein
MSTLQTTNLKHPDAAGNQITFTSGGNTGIGTASPAARLHVADGAGILVQDTGGTERTTQLLQSGNSFFIDVRDDANNGQLVIRGKGGGSASEYARFDTSGQLGIGGTTTVAAKVHIQTNTTGRLLIAPDGSSDYHNKIYNDNGDLMISSEGSASDMIVASNRDVIFRAGGTTGTEEIARVDADGSVLVGTTSWSGDSLLQVDGPIQTGVFRMASHSRSYTASTSATDLFKVRMTGGHGAAEFTWMFVDSGYPNGARIGKIYLAFRGSGSNITSELITSTQEESITNGTVSTITWTASVHDVNHIKLTVTGSTSSGTGTMYIYGVSPFFDTLTPITDV